QLADQALDQHDLDHAAFYAHAADRIEGCEDRAARPLEKVDVARAQYAMREEAGRWPVDDAPMPKDEAERRDYEDLVVATALGDPGGIGEAGGTFPAGPAA